MVIFNSYISLPEDNPIEHMVILRGIPQFLGSLAPGKTTAIQPSNQVATTSAALERPGSPVCFFSAEFENG